MNKFNSFTTATLLTVAMSSTAFATSGDEAETIIKDNTVQNTHVGVKQNTAQSTHVGVRTNAAGGQGGQGGQGGMAEQEQSLNNQNYLNATGGEQEQSLNNQNHLNATGGEQEQQQTANATNGGQNNSQTSNYNSNYKAAASSAYGHAPTAIASSKCGSASSFGVGIQVLAGGAAISQGESTPAGVQLRYINDDGQEAVASLESYATGTPTFKADVSEDLTNPEQATLSCLEEEFNNREDGQQHAKEMRVIDMHANVVEKKANHVCRDDATHYGNHDCIKMGDTSLSFLNQMIGFKPEAVAEKPEAPIAAPATAHNHN